MGNNMSKRTQINSSDADVPEGNTLDIGRDADIDEIYVVQNESMQDDRLKALLKEEADMRAFMEEKVTFSISETDNPNAPNPVPCGVNGDVRQFYRGRVYTECRKFIDSLIKTVRAVKTRQIKDAEGVDDTVIDTTFTVAHPITIHDDPSGEKGRRWFLFQQKNAF